MLSGDGSIPAILHGDSDVVQVAGEFFDGMTKLGTLIENIEDGSVSFNSPTEKQRYLDYLTSAYDKNETLYRNQLASKIDDAKLLQFPKTRFKELINDLTLSQLEGFVEQINENGVKMLSRPRNFENLMKDLLSDKDNALNLAADDTKSPIRPYVFNGIDVVKEAGIQVGGFYYEDGVYKSIITCPGQEPFVIKIGRKFPEEVAIDVRRTDSLSIQSEKLVKEGTSPKAILEFLYALFTGSKKIPELLPAPLGPSDVPYVGDALDRINWWNGAWNLTEDSILVSIYMHFLKDSIIVYDNVWFNRKK